MSKHRKTPPMPGAVQVGSLTYDVSIDPLAFLGVESAGESLYGHTDKSSGVISINPVGSEDRQKATLLHEVIHAAWDEAKLGEKAREEAVATRLAPVLLQVLRDNAELIAWLKDRTRA